jgi:hypothetical protein
MTTEINPHPWGDLTRFRVYAECLTDAKQSRVATENRIERGGTWEESMAEEIIAIDRGREQAYGKMLLSAYQVLVPEHVQDWARGVPGLASGELFARILGGIGHPRVAIPLRWEGSDLIPAGPPFERTLRQLWSYCGIGDPRRNPRKDILGHSPTREDVLAGGKRTTVRPLLHTFTSYVVRSHTRSETVRNSAFWMLYEKTKEESQGKTHQWQCQNKAIPPMRSNGCGTVAHPEWGAPGSVWRPGHIDMHAQRLMAKELLRQIWVVSALEPAAETCGCCEINDYDPAPEGGAAVAGSCLNCTHSPEEHGL